LDDVVVLDPLVLLCTGLANKLAGIGNWSVGAELIGTVGCKIDCAGILQSRNEGFGMFDVELAGMLLSIFVVTKSWKGEVRLIHLKDGEPRRNVAVFVG
jgi:hypothetical protein